MELVFYRTDFHEMLYFKDFFFRTSVEKNQLSKKNNGYFALRPLYIYDNISMNSSYSDNYFKTQSCREKTRIMFNNYPPTPENRAIYETI